MSDGMTGTARIGHLGVRTIAWVLASYAGVAVVQSWPLPAHLFTHLTGQPGGDTGVYVWNLWVFRHELVDAGRWPFSTLAILPLDGPTNLGLHNYTVFNDLLAMPLLPTLGVVATFNVVYLANVALCGLGMFVLAHRVTGRLAEAWIAGAVFACAPFLVARGTAHFSLTAAACLPFFVHWFDRMLEHGRARDGVAAGLAIAWAAYSDPYYAIYAAMLGLCLLASHTLSVRRRSPPGPSRRSLRWLDGAMTVILILVVGVHGLAGGSVRLGSVSLSLRTLYTPMLLLGLLAATRLLLTMRPVVRWHTPPRRWVVLLAVTGVVGAALMAPELQALAALMADGRLVRAPVLWRSSAPGVDLASFLVPNPNHPLAPTALVSWLAREPGQLHENVVSLSWIGLAVMAAAWRWAAFRPPAFWLATTVGFTSLAVGPFLRIAGVSTYLPTPWTFLRYLPVIGDARMPQRFGIVVFLGFAVLTAGALAALGRRFPTRRRTLLAVIGLALAVELLPAPRPLYSAAVPAVYRTVAADPDPVRLLGLPFGVRDGLSSLGYFTAASQYYQATHGKDILGGYLSRVDDETKAAYRNEPVLAALMAFSEGRRPDDALRRRAEATAAAFVASTRLRYVVIDTRLVDQEFKAFAVALLGLSPAETDGPVELYRTDGGR